MFVVFLNAQKTEKKVVFACPPCGCSQDHVWHEAPGVCTACGMANVATYEEVVRQNNEGHPRQRNRPLKRVAIFIFDGVQIIDYTGPYEVFGQVGWPVYTVAEKPEMIKTAMGMQVVPHHTFENLPEVDIVVFPGGGVTQHQNNPKVIQWIKKMTEKSETAMSVCNGAFFLSEAGLLDGKRATTIAALIPALKQASPKAEIVSDQRFVDNGKIVTSAGLSSGIDAALHLVSEQYGIGFTQRIATNLEYEWSPNKGYVRAALADMHLRNATSVLNHFEHETILFEGNREKWENQFLVKTNLSIAELNQLINIQLERGEKWQLIQSNKLESEWKVPTKNNGMWRGKTSIKAQKGGLLVTFQVQQ